MGDAHGVRLWQARPMIWPAWVDIVLGGCGLIWCLDTWRKLQVRAPWHPHVVPSTRWLAVFSFLLLVMGAARWIQNPGG